MSRDEIAHAISCEEHGSIAKEQCKEVVQVTNGVLDRGLFKRPSF